MIARKNVDVIILMAGEGRRLRPLTNDRPKSLLSCDDGESIFSHTVQAVASQSWKATIIPVIGHGRDKVHEEMASLSSLASFDYVYNPFYASTGPLISFWLGLLQSKNDSVVVVNGDTLMKEQLMEKVATWVGSDNNSQSPEISLCVSKAEEFQPDDMKVLLDANGQFSKTGKDIEPAPGVLKSAGAITVRDPRSRKVLKQKIEQLLMDNDCLEKRYYWHNILDELKGVLDINLIEVGPDSWYEVDTLIDLQSMIASG